MSFHSYHIYGYGIKVSDIKCDSVERLKALIHLAPELESEIEKWREESEIELTSVEDYYEFDQDYCLGLATIVRQVIMEIEKIEFEACIDFDGDIYLLYTMSYPWFLPEKEKDMTTERVCSIIAKYFSLITDDELVVDYYDPENGG